MVFKGDKSAQEEKNQLNYERKARSTRICPPTAPTEAVCEGAVKLLAHGS